MHTLLQMIYRPLKWSWYLLNFIREFTLNIFLIFLIAATIGIYLQFKRVSSIPVKHALIMDLTGIIVDKTSVNNKFHQISKEFINNSNEIPQENSLFEIVEILRQAKEDPNITGLVLSLKDFKGADQSSLQYIGKSLHEFCSSGKPIYAIGDNYSQAQYFLASYANKIYLAPQGEVNLYGIATNNLYYKSLLKKLKINSHIFRVGTYKSAVEPFLRDNMSEEAKYADSRWVNQLWQHYLNIVAKNRKITSQQLFPGVNNIINGLRNVQGDTSLFALNNKLVDKLASRSVINDDLIKEFGYDKLHKQFNGISIYDYKLNASTKKGDKIAVIFVNGAILDGQETTGSVGSDTTANQIRSAKLDPDVKAIIFRVNSPGGSVTASEIIRAELESVRSSGKPIVVSMGGMAASGGYWVSTPANYIIASDSTLTGSIGVFGIINTIEKTLDSIGIHADGVSTSSLANISITKKLPSEFAQMMHFNIKNSYNKFINLVAKSRHKTLEEVDHIGQGHVWIGSDAIKNGLIDQIGDFDDAVIKAVKLAKLKKYQLKWYLNKPSLLELLLIKTSTLIHSLMPNIIQPSLSMPIMQEATNKLKMDFDLRFNWNDPKNSYALCLSREQIIY